MYDILILILLAIVTSTEADLTPQRSFFSFSYDAANNSLLIFGGLSPGSANSDVWRFSLDIKEWKCIHNCNGSLSTVFGQQGVSSPEVTPGAVSQASTFTDSQGSMWIFNGANTIGSLWKFQPAIEEWTWMRGNTTLSYWGTRGIASVDHYPGYRHSSVMWGDVQGNIWMFGGAGYSSDGFNGYLQDLWRYSRADNLWTWMTGVSTRQQYGRSDFLGIPSTEFTPGSRSNCGRWIDSTGNFWLYGGEGYTNQSQGVLSDLWRFNPQTNEWTWVSGSNKAYELPSYGPIGLPSSLSLPGSGFGAATWYDSASEELYMFGGAGTWSQNITDFWKFSPASNLWTFLGNSSRDNYTLPSARVFSAHWIDTAGLLWLYGGTSANRDRTDFWYYTPATNEWTFYHQSSPDAEQPGATPSNNEPISDVPASSFTDEDVPVSPGFLIGILAVAVMTLVMILVTLIYCCRKRDYPKVEHPEATLVYLDDPPMKSFRCGPPLPSWLMNKKLSHTTRAASLAAMIIQLAGLAFLIIFAVFYSSWLENFESEEHSRFPRCPGQTIRLVSDVQAIFYYLSSGLLTLAGCLWIVAHVCLYTYIKLLLSRKREPNKLGEHRNKSLDACCWLPWACCASPSCVEGSKFRKNNRRAREQFDAFYGRNSAALWNKLGLACGIVGAVALIVEAWISTIYNNQIHTTAAFLYVLFSSLHYIVILAVNYEYFEMRAPLNREMLYTFKSIALVTIVFFAVSNGVADKSDELCNFLGDARPIFEWYAFFVMVVSHGIFYGDVASFQYKTTQNIPL